MYQRISFPLVSVNSITIYIFPFDFVKKTALICFNMSEKKQRQNESMTAIEIITVTWFSYHQQRLTFKMKSGNWWKLLGCNGFYESRSFSKFYEE